MRILLVEDEPDLGRTLMRVLGEAGFSVDLTEDGEEALLALAGAAYDAAVLDIMLPGLDGWEVLRRTRAAGRRLPILVLTARDATADRVKGLDLGADDYLVKPFALDELLARLRALVRRAAGLARPELTLGDSVIDFAARRVSRNGRPVDLSPKEFALLELLALRRGTLVTRAMIYDHIYDDREDTSSNVLEVYVSNLRRKLGRDLIETRRGEGYIIDEAAGRS